MNEEMEKIQFEIIDATAEDVDGIKAVQGLTWLMTYPNDGVGIGREDIEEHLNAEGRRERYEGWKERINKQDDSHTFVSKVGEKVVGFCNLTKSGVSRIAAFYVLPEYQGKGIGGRLMEESLNWLGVGTDVYVNVASYNEQAIGFYKRYGFVETGAIPEPARLPSGKEIPEIEMLRQGGV